MGYPLVPLGEVVKVVGGGTPSRKVSSLWKGEIPWASVKDLNDELDIRRTAESISLEGLDASAANLIPAGQVIIATRVGLGKVAVNAVPMAINQDLKALFCSERLNARYLAHALRHKAPQLISMGVGATVKGYNLKDLLGVEIPVPPLVEQRRIAHLLDEADRLQRLRKEANEKARKILPMLFRQMFGDPDTNPMGWKTVPVSEFALGFQSGKSIAPEADGKPTRNRVLKISAVTTGQFRADKSKPVADGYVPPSSHFAREGDLLFSRANTTQMVGATALVDEPVQDLLLPDKLWRFVLREDCGVQSRWVLSLFQHPAVREQIGRRATGTSGSMQNISMDKVLSLRVPFPPSELQARFAHIAASVATLRTQQDEAEGTLATQSAVLRSRLFAQAV